MSHNTVKNGRRELWELAEYFGVSYDFMEKAITLYAQQGKIVPESLYANL